VRPGITGLAQVFYPYGASVEDAREKLRYELYYARHISLGLDLRALAKTINVVLAGRGQ
jgi:lipopolysaccharide/colanic/teichoic acid biosynthesis glycosyltransferase